MHKEAGTFRREGVVEREACDLTGIAAQTAETMPVQAKSFEPRGQLGAGPTPLVRLNRHRLGRQGIQRRKPTHGMQHRRSIHRTTDFETGTVRHQATGSIQA